MCQLNQPVQRGQIALLLIGSEPDHFHAVETGGIEKIGIGRREESAILVTEDDQKSVESIFREEIEIARPVALVVEPAFPMRPVPGVDRERAIAHEWRFRRVVYFAPWIFAWIRRPAHAL